MIALEGFSQPPAKPQTPPTTPKLSSSTGEKIPTDEEIKAFVQEYKETTSSNESLSLQVRMGAQKKKPEDQKKSKLTQKVPYQLFIDLIKTKTVANKKTMTRVTNGKCNVAIMDAKGSVLKNSSENLIRLCASWKGGGGLSGEMAEGTYKVIVWIRKPNGVILGRVIDATLTP